MTSYTPDPRHLGPLGEPRRVNADGTLARRARYSRWDGTQSIADFDADEIIDALADDVMAEGDLQEALRFYRPASGDLKLVYGRDDLQPPKYDLALLAREVLGAPASEIAAERAPSSTDGDSDARSFVSPTLFWVLLGAAVIVLLGLIVRLVKS